MARKPSITVKINDCYFSFRPRNTLPFLNELISPFQRERNGSQKQSCKASLAWRNRLSLFRYQKGTSLTSNSVQFSRSVVSDPLRPYGLQHGRLPCPSLSPGVCSNSCPWSRWCHPTISSSAAHPLTSNSHCNIGFDSTEKQSQGETRGFIVLPLVARGGAYTSHKIPPSSPHPQRRVSGLRKTRAV